MKKMDTKFAVENVMCCAISEWFETGHVHLDKYPEEYHGVIWSQGAIGWDKYSMDEFPNYGWSTKVIQKPHQDEFEWIIYG